MRDGAGNRQHVRLTEKQAHFAVANTKSSVLMFYRQRLFCVVDLALYCAIGTQSKLFRHLVQNAFSGAFSALPFMKSSNRYVNSSLLTKAVIYNNKVKQDNTISFIFVISNVAFFYKFLIYIMLLCFTLFFIVFVLIE